MKRSIVVALLSSCLGVPAAVGVTEVCSTKTFDQAWRQRVREILAWNKAHPDVVKRRHLDRDMSAETRRARERLRKRLDLACGMEMPSGPLVLSFPEVAPVPIVTEREFGAPGDGLDLIAEMSGPAAALIPSEDYPSYDVPSHTLPDGPPSLGGWGPGYFGGGYLPPQPPDHPEPPSSPLAPAPEPLPFGLVAFGAAFLIIRRNKSCGVSERAKG